MDCLQQLVENIHQSSPYSKVMITDGEYNIRSPFNNVHSCNQQMLQCLLEGVKQIIPIPVPIGLRKCKLCGENLATVSRIQSEIRFDTSMFDLYSAAVKLLQRMTNIGFFRASSESVKEGVNSK